jgi:hypothetical protein
MLAPVALLNDLLSDPHALRRRLGEDPRQLALAEAFVQQA